jgi:hypothetical protein
MCELSYVFEKESGRCRACKFSANSGAFEAKPLLQIHKKALESPTIPDHIQAMFFSLLEPPSWVVRFCSVSFHYGNHSFLARQHHATVPAAGNLSKDRLRASR